MPITKIEAGCDSYGHKLIIFFSLVQSHIFYKFITVLDCHIISDFGIIFLPNFESKCTNWNKKFWRNKFKINWAFLNQFFDYFKSLLIVDTCSVVIILLIKLTYFDIGFEVFRIKL